MIIRNMRHFENIRLRKNASNKLFSQFERGTVYNVSLLNSEDFPEPKTGYVGNYSGTPISSLVFGDRTIDKAYQDDLLTIQTINEGNTHTPRETNDNFSGFIFNNPTKLSTFILKPAKDSGTGRTIWPHGFYVIASNDGVSYEQISDNFTNPVTYTTYNGLAIYDINPEGKSFTEYRLRMSGNSFNAQYQYIDALYWY